MVVHGLLEAATRPFLGRGARLASSPAEVARLSEVTFTSLPGPREVEEVFTGSEGLLEGAGDGGIYVDLSTSRPTLIRALEPLFKAKGAHVLEAVLLAPPSGAVRALRQQTARVLGGVTSPGSLLLTCFHRYKCYSRCIQGELCRSLYKRRGGPPEDVSSG